MGPGTGGSEVGGSRGSGRETRARNFVGPEIVEVLALLNNIDPDNETSSFRHQSYERFTSLCLQTCEYKCF